jgi:hypothetical protein
MFSDLNEIFFCDFPHLLQQWLLRLKDNHPTNKIRQMEWNPMEITQLQKVNKKFTRVVDFWLDNIVAWFITEFVEDTVKSCTKKEHDFLKGPRGRYIRLLYNSIKILLYNNSVITMELDN